MLFFLKTNLFSQNKKISNSFWNLKSINGYLSLSGNFYKQKTTLNSGIVFEQISKQYNGILSLNTRSYIIHPNLIQLELNGIFRPGTRNDKFIITPSTTDVTIAEQLNLKAYIFKNLPINGGFNFIINHSFINRDFTSNVENNRKSIGVYFNYRNYFVPISLKYDFDNNRQDELELNRFFEYTRHNFNANFTNWLSSNINNRLIVNYSSILNKYSYNQSQVYNKIFDANFSSVGKVNLAIPINYLSTIWYNNNSGDNSENRIQVVQNISADLPYNLKFLSNYNYYFLSAKLISSKNNIISATLNHKLFQSLFSHLNFEYSNFKQNTFSEIIKTFQGGFNYTKEIPSGELNFSYEYSKSNKSKTSLNLSNVIINEKHNLIDGSIELLKNANVIMNSIIVSNFQNTIIYQENIDYEIIKHGEFLEIRRILGGRILNNAVVYIDYQYNQNDSYNYVSRQHTYSLRLLLFKNFLEISYYRNEISIGNEGNITSLSLRDISQRVVKISFNYNDFSAGFKYDTFRSNIIPYKTQEYFFEYNNMVVNTILISFTTNYRKQELIEDNEVLKFIDVVGRMTYYLNQKARILLKGSYRNQVGKGINLDLQNLKIEYQTNYRAIKLALGFELYNRIFLRDKINYFRGYIKLQRNF